VYLNKKRSVHDEDEAGAPRYHLNSLIFHTQIYGFFSALIPTVIRISL